MRLIDTHAHLYLEEFSKDIEVVIQRAVKEGVKHIILPNIDSRTIVPLHRISDNFQGFLIPLMGLHPTSVDENYESELNTILEQLQQFQYKGIGEIGIDLYWEKKYLREQIIIFEKQLEVSVDMQLPVVIHSRDSFPEVLNSVKKFKGLKGIFHAFSGPQEIAKQIISLGFFLGIGGVLTYKNSQLAELVKTINLKHMVLETDSPYLAPVPYRGKRNESSYLTIIANEIATLKKVTPEEVYEVTSSNAIELFNL